MEIEDIDLLNIDTQGYEMEVLKGSRKLLSQGIKYIILEVNKKELYEGCPLVKDIDNFLKKYDFISSDSSIIDKNDNIIIPSYFTLVQAKNGFLRNFYLDHHQR